MAEGSSSDGRSASHKAIKTIRFALGKGNKNDGKLVVVHKDILTDSHAPLHGAKTIRDKQMMPNFIRDTLLTEEFLGSKPPKVIISVTGAAGSYTMDAQLERLFYKGLVNAAKSTTAWITSGGTDVGIMHYVGEAIRQLVTDVPTIGFATYNKINNRQLLKSPDNLIEYDSSAPANNSVNLNANHSHFVLVESNKDVWGEEIEARSDFEEFICTVFNLPLCLIVVNGGPGTLKTVAEGAARNFPVVILEGTGRAADAVAREIRKKRKEPFEHLETMKLEKELVDYMNTIVANESVVTLYTPNSGPLDFAILNAILSCDHSNFSSKLNLAIEWDRVDLVNHLLDHQSKDRPLSSDEFASVLSSGLETALDLERPELFRLLYNRGARKADINLVTLYTAEVDGKTSLDPTIARYTPHIRATGDVRERMLGKTVEVSNRTPLLGSGILATPAPIGRNELSLIKAIFRNVNPVFEHYARSLGEKFVSHDLSASQSTMSIEYGAIMQKGSEGAAKNPETIPLKNLGESQESKVKLTDAMLWAILMGRLDLAKVIWEKTTLPVHAALIASGLCKGVSNWLLNEKQAFEDAAAWFEGVATTFIGKMDYDDAKVLLTYVWDEFGFNALEIAVKTECQEFTANAHVQRYMDELLYRDDYGGIPLGTNFWKVIMCILLPFLLYFTNTYDNIVGDKINQRSRWYHFYRLPYTKFWTSTFCYIGYLVLLSVVLVAYQDTYSISGAEILLWVWMLGMAVEELSQWRAEGSSYLNHASNQMDVFILILQAFYIGFSIAASVHNQPEINNASTNILIVTTIISFIRLLDVFAISKDLGPLYFVLKKIIGDVGRWVFVFVLFAIGFQVSFMALNAQAQRDAAENGEEPIPNKWVPTIDGGTFMGAFYTIVGDWDTTMQVLKHSWFGTVVVSLYALIAQIALVNLLIAMMGDTFNSVKENSDKEWKYSRYDMIVEYSFASFHPPPFNLIAIPIKRTIMLFSSKKHKEEVLRPEIGLTKKQKEQFKNLMRNTKDSYLEDVEQEDQKSIGAVSQFAKDGFKTLQDEQVVRFRSIEQQLSDLATKQTSGPSVNNNNNSQQVDVNAMSDRVNALVKNELSQLQKTLLEAITNQKPVESMQLHIQNTTVPLTWSENIKQEHVHKVVNEYKPFREWVESMNKPENVTGARVQGVHINGLDMFGARIGFVKFDCKVVNEGGQRIPGIVFMRGAAVGMLIILKVDEEGSPEHGKLFTLLTIQPRVPAGEARFAEIPAGMLDGGEFAGIAAKEIKEEVGLEIKETELIDLTGMAYNNAHKGVYPSAGGCDEFLRLFVYRNRVSAAALNSYRDKLTGEITEGERITLKVIPLEDLWVEAPDAKALSALYLYESLVAKGRISAEF